LKTPLFVRSRVGWTPTTAGHLYIDLAKNVMELKRQTYAQISLVSSSFSHTISLGISPGRMTNMAADCFPAFNSRFPNIKLALKEASVFDIIRQMRRQQVDIGFITSSSEFSDLEEIVLHPLRSENFVLALPCTHPFAQKSGGPAQVPYPTVSLAEFRECEFMLMQPNTTLREAQDQIFAHSGFSPKILFESASSQTIHSLAQVGYAAALIPASYATPTTRSVYFNIDDPIRWKLFAAHHTSHKLSIPEEYFVSLAASYYNGGGAS